MTERAEVEGVELAYEDSGGDGPVVVLVHGLGGSLYGWRAQIRALADSGYRAIAYDQRGAGLSEKPARPILGRGLGGRPGRARRRPRNRAARARRPLDGLHGRPARRRCASADGAGRWRSAAGARSGPSGRARSSSSAPRSARAGRMDEVAEAVAAGGLSEACRAEQPALWGLDGRRGSPPTTPRPTPSRPWPPGARRWPGSRSSPARCSPSRAPRTPLTPPESAEEIAAAAPQRRVGRHRAAPPTGACSRRRRRDELAVVGPWTATGPEREFTGD